MAWYQYINGQMTEVQPDHREYAIWYLGTALEDAATVVRETWPLTEEEIDSLVESFNKLLKLNHRHVKLV